ncbi:YoaK family small membrane protein [Serratia sp. 201]
MADMQNHKNENNMKIGYLFPVAIIVAAVVLLAWFIIGGYAMP